MEALLAEEYAGHATFGAIIEAVDTAAEKLHQSMPDRRDWGTTPKQVESSRKAEEMFGPR